MTSSGFDPEKAKGLSRRQRRAVRALLDAFPSGVILCIRVDQPEQPGEGLVRHHLFYKERHLAHLWNSREVREGLLPIESPLRIDTDEDPGDPSVPDRW